MQADVAIVGGGMAGSLAAAMLGRAGVDTLLIDPNAAYPADFRCEKLEAGQLQRLRRTGLADAILPATTPCHSLWIARYGHIVDRRPETQADARYEGMVAAARAAVRGSARLLVGRAEAIEASEQRQRVRLRGGQVVSARLVVLATGPSQRLARHLGLTRSVRARHHSVSIGFDLVPAAGTFPFQALTWYPHRSPPGVAYLTLFPIGGAMRANLFAHWAPASPWLARLREAPEDALREILPGLDRVTGPAHVQGLRTRFADLYTTRGVDCPGVVLIGDAYASSCPSAGTGLDKVFTDVERLCSAYVPRWLASPGMAADKVAAFYADPIKRDCDRWSLERAVVSREAAVSRRLSWRIRRRATYLGQRGAGALRALKDRR